MMEREGLAKLLVAALSGALFGAGLQISGMIDPLKVLRFLDVGAIPVGGWDPSLAFVIVPAIAIMMVAVQIGKRREAPLFEPVFHTPEFEKIDGRLVGGAALFGVGWGMSGLCPGPAIALLALMPENLFWFLVPMLAGSLLGGTIMPSRHDARLMAAR